jgi:hypothetical protein
LHHTKTMLTFSEHLKSLEFVFGGDACLNIFAVEFVNHGSEGSVIGLHRVTVRHRETGFLFRAYDKEKAQTKSYKTRCIQNPVEAAENFRQGNSFPLLA